jgi:hypothetical protein
LLSAATLTAPRSESGAAGSVSLQALEVAALLGREVAAARRRGELPSIDRGKLAELFADEGGAAASDPVLAIAMAGIALSPIEGDENRLALDLAPGCERWYPPAA